MNKRNKSLITVVILVTCLVFYNICFFVIPFNREHSNASMWISYAFTFLFTIAMGVIALISFNKKGLRSKILGIPIFAIGFATLIAQFIVDIVIMILGNWVPIYFWITIIIESLLVALLIIFTIIRTNYREYIELSYRNENDSTRFIQSIRKEVKILFDTNNDSILRKKLFKLQEAAIYTDPVSTMEVVSIENEILDRLNELKKYIRIKNIDKASQKIDEITQLLKERKIRLR